ncbi:MAG TPA: response regulator transcription factor [Anaerolineales bacterium]
MSSESSLPVRVILIAPTLAVRAGLRTLLSAGREPADAGQGLEVVWEAAAFSELEGAPADADVLVAMGAAVSSLDIQRAAHGLEGHLALLLLVDDPQTASGLSSLPLRAWGVLSMDASAEELAAAVRALHEGLLVGEPRLLTPLLVRQLISGEVLPEPLVEPLTEREIQVLQLLAQGLANKQIASRLGISEHTVKFHVSGIYSKLGVTNRTEAARQGVQRGLIAL